MRIKLLARPDHSVALYSGLINRGIDVDYRTFFAFREGGFLSKMMPRRKSVPPDAKSSITFTIIVYINNVIGKRIGYNWRSVEAYFSKRLLSTGDIKDIDLIHYWPFYYGSQIEKIKNEEKGRAVVTLAEFYEAESKFVNDLYIHEFNKVGIPFYNPINLMINQNFAFKYETQFCVASEFTKISYLSRFPKAKIHVVSYGLMGRNVKAAKRMGQRLRWVFVGQICIEKGIHLLLDAFTSLPELTLDLIGPIRPGQRDYFQMRIDSLRNVCWIGAMSNNQVKNKLADYDAFVLPSIADNYSISVTESLCEGMPVVVTNHCGNSDDVGKYGLGKVCQAGDAESLSTAIYEVAYKFDTDKFQTGLMRFKEDENDCPYAARVKMLYEELLLGR